MAVAASAVGKVPGLFRGAASIGSLRLIAAANSLPIEAGVVANPGVSGLILTRAESYRRVLQANF